MVSIGRVDLLTRENTLQLRFSLKTKVSMVVFLLVTVLLSLGGSFFFYYFERNIKQEISEQQFNLVSKLAEWVDTNIRFAQDIIVRAAARVPADTIDDPDQAQIFLDSHLGTVSTLFDNGVFLFSAEGRMVAETPFIPGRRGKDYSFREYFQRTVATDQPYISIPYFSSQTHGNLAVNFTAPVHNSAGELIGVLAGSLDLTQDNMLGRIAKTKIGKTGYLYLYSTDRLMIMHPKTERILKKDVPLGANIFFDKAINGFEGSGETVNSRGLHALATFKRLESLDWILAANYPSAEAFSSIHKVQRYFWVGMVFFLLVTVLVTWFAMRWLIAPLQYFISHIEDAVVSKDTQKLLQLETTDEISSLADAFARLMHDVEEQKQRVQQQLLFQKTLVDTIPNPIYYKDIEGKYLGCNKAFEQLYGLDSAEIIGSTIDEIASPEMAKILGESDEELFRQKDNSFQIFEYALTYADGSHHDALFYKAIYKDAAGDPAGLVGIIVDISQRKEIEIALAEQHRFATNLLQNSAVPCFVLDVNHKVIAWTSACEELTGLAGKDLLGTDEQWRAFYSEKRPCLADLVLDKDLEGTLDLYESFSNSQLIAEGVQAEGWFPNISGKTRYLRFDAAPIYDTAGALIASIETLHDLTSQKQTEQSLRESEQSLLSLIERSPDAILVHRAGKVILANPSAAKLFIAASVEKLVDIQLLDLVHPDYRELVHERVTYVEAHHVEKPYIEEKLLRLDGSTVDVEASSTPVFYGETWAVQTILRDITERKEMQERVWRQANYDTLTWVPNRFMFLDRLQQSLEGADREQDRVALLFIDLDHFKAVNDTLGHEAGDVLLREVAKRLTKSIRKTDTLSRIGGDEFTVILTHVVTPVTVKIVVERILKSLFKKFNLPGGEGQISGSIGIAFYPEDGKDITALLKKADAAMYQAKERGRNTFHFSTSPESLEPGKRPLD
jgi:two-component system NtrC family sensor kinase